MRGYSETGKLKTEAIVVSRPSGYQAQLRIAGVGSWFGSERDVKSEAETDLAGLRIKHEPKKESADGLSDATREAMNTALIRLKPSPWPHWPK